MIDNRILIADDDVEFRGALEQFLRSWGYEVLCVKHGLEAWQVLLSEAPPRLMILDWMMPGMDGLEVCRRLRSQPDAPYSYIIMLTVLDELEMLAEGFRAGADDYLTKPVLPQELKARLMAGRRVLEKQEKTRRDLDHLQLQALQDPLTGLWNRSGIMRILLFLAILGVTTAGVALDPANPAASAFEHAAGVVGLRVFGVILWAAAITSVIGASYTSVSFLTRSSTPERTRNLLTVGFIVIGTVLYVALGKAPVTLLIFAGAFNGVILPLGFTVILWVAWRRRDLLHGYRYPAWLLGVGVLAWVLTLWLGAQSLGGLAALWS